MAISCCLPPFGISHRREGVTVMYLRTAAWQVTLVVPLTVPLVAEIVAEPVIVALALQVTRPVADTVATLGTLELHWAVFVSTWVSPAEKWPVGVRRGGAAGRQFHLRRGNGAGLPPRRQTGHRRGTRCGCSGSGAGRRD